MTISKILYNMTISDIDIADTGITVMTSEPYQIPPQDFQLWAASQSIIPYIADGSISIFDGEIYLSPRYGRGLIQNNNILITEFYSLCQDDSILVGNGSILNIHE